MNWIPAGIALLIGLVAIVYIIYPLLQANADEPIRSETDDAVELIQRKDAALRSIKELEFDFQTGKLSDEDFTRLNYQLRQQAIALIRRIETASPELVDLEASLEEAIVMERGSANGL